MLTSSEKSLHSGAYLPLTVLQATPIIYSTSSTLCCGAQVQLVSMRLLKETGQNILTGFPPFNLIPSVISIIRQFSAASILALPLWPSSPWWPLLSKGQHFFPFVHGCRVLPRLQNLLTPGPSTASAPRAFTRWRWTFLAVLCFSANPPPQPIPIPSYACRTQQVHP